MKQQLAKHTSLFLVLSLLAISASLVSCFASYSQSDENQADYINYAPPPWAPPYDNVSSVRYYYLPDYDMYYDVWERQYYYQNDGAWIASYDLPPMWAGVDLGSAFVVLIDRDVDRPWRNHDYYVQNYPHHGHDQYKDIVVKNRIITNVRPGHELVPRAYNENTNRVTFMQHPIQGDARAGTPDQNRGANPGQPRQQNQPGGSPGRTQPPVVVYHQQVHEVPIKSIAPSMPAAARSFNYGGAQNKPPQSAPAPRSAPAAAPARAKSENQH